MKALLQAIWKSDRRAFLRILFLNILVSLLSGIGIVMLIPLLNLLNIGAGDANGLLARLCAPLLGLPYAGQVTAILALYILLVTVKALLGRLLSIRENAFIENTGFRLRSELYSAVAGTEWEQLASERHTDTINLFTQQCGQVCYGFDAIIGLFSSAVTSIVQLSIALWMNAPLTVLVCLMGGAMVQLFKPLRKKSRDFGEETIRINRDFYAELESQLSSVKEVRAYGVEREHAAQFGRISAAYRDAHLRYTRLFTIPQVVYAVTAALMIAGVYLVSTLILQVETDRLVVLVYIFARLWPVFSGLQGQIQYIHGCVPAYEKLNEAMQSMQATPEHAEAEEETEDVFSGWHELEFKNVCFSYHDGDAPVLRSVSFCLEPGRVTALLGRNGTGKTTLANLLLGVLKPKGGQITVDGVPLTPQNLRTWRRQVGYVPQEPLILNASVRENLLRFHPAATEDEMTDALKRAMAWEFVSALPQGLDTLLGERGVRLSGGERQRLVLARILIGRPRLIILDEATSALDYESETAFRELVRTMSGNAAVLLIAHRLATIRMATHAIVLENGEIAEQGTMSELLRKPGGYLAGMVCVE